MKKLKVTTYARKLLFDGQCKIERLRYPDIDHIFGHENEAPDFASCRYANKLYLERYKLYAKYGSFIEGHYQDILYKLSHLIQEIKPNPTIEEILFIYAYILRKGYLSLDNELKFIYPKKELDVRPGLSIVTGESVCRNYTAFLSDLLFHFNINSIPIMTDRLTKESEPIHIIPELEALKHQTHDQDDTFEKEFNEKAQASNGNVQFGNHSELLVFDRHHHLLDPTSISLSIITSKETEYKALDFLKLWSLYATGMYNIKTTCSFYHQLKDKSLKVVRSKALISTQHECYDSCEHNKEKIKRFNETIKEDISFLNEELSY